MRQNQTPPSLLGRAGLTRDDRLCAILQRTERRSCSGEGILTAYLSNLHGYKSQRSPRPSLARTQIQSHLIQASGINEHSKELVSGYLIILCIDPAVHEGTCLTHKCVHQCSLLSLCGYCSCEHDDLSLINQSLLQSKRRKLRSLSLERDKRFRSIMLHQKS